MSECVGIGWCALTACVSDVKCVGTGLTLLFPSLLSCFDSDKEVFIRELISNASDALEKLK